MKLSQLLIDEYERNGFLFFPSLLSQAEMSVIRRELDVIAATPRREIVYEKDGKTLRSIFNMHAYNEAFARLVRHPKVVEPVRALLGEPIYVFQIVLNFKEKFGGDDWPWHQDYPTYHFDDGMREPKVVNTLIFVDEINEFNAPLMLIPGSHKCHFPLPDINTTQTSYPARWLPPRFFETIARENGIVAPKGPAGSVIFAHTNIIHGSVKNMSPWGRALISLTINAVSNAARGSRRPDYIVPNDRTPLEPLGENCLEELARQRVA
jgi:ectoine hydroxylase